MKSTRKPTDAEILATLHEKVPLTLSRMEWLAVCGAILHVLAHPDAEPPPPAALKVLGRVLSHVEQVAGVEYRR